jgi:trehalose-6-phosphate synthase
MTAKLVGCTRAMHLPRIPDCFASRYQGTPEGVEDNGSLTRVAAFPIGIDPERFAAALEEDSVRGSIAQLLNKYAGRKVWGPAIQVQTS